MHSGQKKTQTGQKNSIRDKIKSDKRDKKTWTRGPEGYGRRLGPRRVGPRRVGPRRVGPPRVGPLIVGAPALFFPLSALIIVLFLSFSGVFLVEFWWCLEHRDRLLCTCGRAVRRRAVWRRAVRWRAVRRRAVLQPPPTSCNRHWKVQVAKHDVRRHSGASFAAQSSGSTLDCKSPSPQHPSSGTRSSTMAKGVEKTATTTGTHREGERKTETAQQDHPAKVGFDVGEEVGSAGRKSHASLGPALGAQQGLFVLGKAFHQVTAELAHPRGGLMLPTVPRLRARNHQLRGWWSSPSHQSIPPRNLKTFHSSQLPGSLEAACKDGDSQSSTPLSCRTIIVATPGCLS